MINKFNGFERRKYTSAREILPAGGYVGKILKAEVVHYSWGDRLHISFDITEGEFKDFFKKDWENNTNEDRKWRGVLRLNLPAGDGSAQDAWKVSAINNLAASLEESNSGYTWDWDETKLKGKALGFLVREFEWEVNGNSGWSTEAASCTDVESIRSGKFRLPKKRPLKRSQQAEPATAPGTVEEPDDLPF